MRGTRGNVTRRGCCRLAQSAHAPRELEASTVTENLTIGSRRRKDRVGAATVLEGGGHGEAANGVWTEHDQLIRLHR